MPRPFQLQRFEALLRKRLGLQGLVGLTLLEDVQCVIPLWGPGSAPEDLFLKGENRWAQHIVGGPLAGNFTGASLQNPATSRTLVVVESIDNISPAQDVNVGVFEGASAGGGPGQPLDLRQFQQAPRPVAGPAITNSPVAQVANFIARLRITGIGWREPVVVPPNSFIFAEGTLANTAFGVIFQWREVPLATVQELEQHG